MSIKRHGGERFSGNPTHRFHSGQKVGMGTVHVPTEKEIWRMSPALGIARQMMGIGKDAVDDRRVAVAFYMRVLQAAVSGEASLMNAANRVGAKFPECIQLKPIIHAAVHVVEEAFKEPLSTKEGRNLETMILEHLSNTFVTHLREARIFQMREHDYLRLYRLADMHTNTAVGLKWELQDLRHPKPQRPLAELARVAEYTVNEGVNVPFPEKLPFESCYFAWGCGIPPTESQHKMWQLDPKGGYLIIATLLQYEGWCFTIVLRGDDNDPKYPPRPIIVLERIGRGHDTPNFVVSRRVAEMTEKPKVESLINPGWTQPYGLVPWIVTQLIDLIDRNDSLTKVQPGLLKERIAFKQLSKRTGQRFLPKPYYVVLIQPTVYEEVEERIKSQPRSWSHRWDVIGHYGHKIARGTLPMDPKLVWQLHKRKYEIFHAMNRPSGEVLAFLMRKRVAPPREGEWLAYLKFRRDAYIKGPQDKPYVPSVHRLRQGVPEVV
jgi:hypothetical protein